jgi:catechol 2,3-dioxygenase
VHGAVEKISIDPETEPGAVRLTVSDIGRAQMFYERVLGLRSSELDDGGLGLGVAGGSHLVELYGDRSAPRLNRRVTGLFHLALLVPSRRDLAFALMRLADERWPLDGASDHLVSEALYLSDPDGNGIEVYRDRPREEWQHQGGDLRMATLALDLQGLVGELGGSAERQREAPSGTRMGHVHLQVSSLPDSEAFYSGILGFDVTVRSYPGALFVSAGGYHHHIGMNTWYSEGASSAPPGSVGLRSFVVRVPDRSELERLAARVRDAGLEIGEAGEERFTVQDPSGNRVEITSAPRGAG